MKLFGLTNLSSAAFSLVIGVLLTGCFSEAKNLSTYQDLTQNSSKSDQVVTIFVKGEIDLSCGPTCSGDWGFNQRKIKYYWKGKGIKSKCFDKKGRCIIECDKEYFRPLEVDTLLGNSKKAFKELKWKPKIHIKQLIKEMVESEISSIKND